MKGGLVGESPMGDDDDDDGDGKGRERGGEYHCRG